MNREMCGVFFRVERNGKWENICFSDMTDEEMDTTLARNAEPAFANNLCKILAKALRAVGDQFDLRRGFDE